MLAWCVQALTPLTIGRSNIKATLMGALWGFGHSIGQLILGLLMVLLKVSQCIHDQSMPEIISSSVRAQIGVLHGQIDLFFEAQML